MPKARDLAGSFGEEAEGREPKAHGSFFLGLAWSFPFCAFYISKGHWISLIEHVGVIVMWESWENP